MNDVNDKGGANAKGRLRNRCANSLFYAFLGDENLVPTVEWPRTTLMSEPLRGKLYHLVVGRAKP